MGARYRAWMAMKMENDVGAERSLETLVADVLVQSAKMHVRGHRSLRSECERDARAVVKFLKSRGIIGATALSEDPPTASAE